MFVLPRVLGLFQSRQRTATAVTTPADNNGGDVPAVVVVSVAAIIVALVAGITALAYAGKNPAPLVTAAGVLSPFIIALLAVRNSHRAERQIADVKQRVDGKIDGLITDKANLEHQVSVAGSDTDHRHRVIRSGIHRGTSHCGFRSTGDGTADKSLPCRGGSPPTKRKEKTVGDRFFNILTAITTIGLVTAIVSRPASADIIKAMGDAFGNSIKAALGN
jgi:hypothetical protein